MPLRIGQFLFGHFHIYPEIKLNLIDVVSSDVFNGINLCLLWSQLDTMNGFTLSVYENHCETNGLSTSLVNQTKTLNGVSFSLVNATKSYFEML